MLPLPFTPAATLVLFLAGALFLAWESNRPGTLVPGALGLIASLVALASVASMPHHALALTLLVAAFLLMLLTFRRPHPALLAATAAGWIAAFASFAPLLFAVPAALLLAAVTGWLARVAFLARRNKGHK